MGQCLLNAYSFKKRNPDKNLRIVIGSLGLAGHFEYGGKHHTIYDYHKNPFDSHAWLEDDEGNVYDYIFEDYIMIAKYWSNKKPQFKVGHINGVSKSHLQSIGLEYIEAPKSSQADIVIQYIQLLSRMKVMRNNKRIYKLSDI